MRSLLLVLCFVWMREARSQQLRAFADSLRIAHGLPEIGFAVISQDSILQLEVIGIKQSGTDRVAEDTDHFRIGSNTKIITALIARRAVERGLLNWDTRLLDQVPELAARSKKVYRDATLLGLLDFRVRFIPWTYTYAEPDPARFSGDAGAQRLQLMQWAVQQPPVDKGNGHHFSNLSYVASGLMLERATGRSYQQLVQDLGAELGIEFLFGTPNVRDPSDTWGHDAQGTPEAPAPNVKLDWLLCAGGISLSLPQHAAFMRTELKRIAAWTEWLTPQGFAALEHDRKTEALAWKWDLENDPVRLYHVGNPGTFLTKVYLHPCTDRAYLLYANQRSEGAGEGLDALYLELVRTSPGSVR